MPCRVVKLDGVTRARLTLAAIVLAISAWAFWPRHPVVKTGPGTAYGCPGVPEARP